MAALLLWLHALAALLFGALALWAWRTGVTGLPRRPLAFALAATALWALAIAGIGSTDIATWFAESLRNLAWLGFMLMLHRRDAQTRPPIALGTVYGVVALVQIAALVLTLISYTNPAEIAAQIANAAVLLRMLVAVAALVLVQALWSALSPAAGGPLRTLVLALAGIWCAEFALYGIAYLAAQWRFEPLVVRGIAYVAVALAIGAALQRKGDWKIEVSRAVTYQSLSLVAIGAYFALLALATSAIAAVGGTNARILQTAFVLGSTAAILTLVANSWLRAWLKVKLAKHLFRHRYDYRTEWMRFTETLGTPQGGAGLDERIVKAVADLTESPAGVLLVPDASGLGVGASWNWDSATLPIASDEALARHLHDTGRIVELDAVRRKEDHLDAPAVPQWMLDLHTAWVLVPLPHHTELTGAILLARPPLDRALDWEDFDLLKVAGRQAASYLAESRAQDALAEAQRFDEFNRRFAFILHDIKNLVSQLTLTARNAERHADNPEFRADMVATLHNSAERMNALLARLSQNHRGRSEAPHAIEIVALIERVAGQRKGQHPVVTSGVRSAIAHADPASLEQLLGHLVQNAIEASPTHEPVTLSVSADGERVAIDVIDQGIGMSPAFIRDKLFKPFVSSKDGGFGIGAFEARQLAHAMEGRIEVTSREGKGTRFRVILKAAHPADLGAPNDNWGHAA
ncbi:PEP-CTERM system histidine kinase PrsK [Sphingomonas sp. R-74633]|uniref:XrtA/PEP-CTERM system histidine kinase PrsK n=1 Tax=Sphingomonas sp. R-74633 TaxID=2751188 RepID=UPI0015D1BDE4|nr:XrtA/PEP-CTERM system histidine kinase PrsK [Sphingomonas sp. R-74633]NYT41172.1 PEP-CTERM system histidine kinase PrsK [Sphingomonas sp. R-74633]